MFKGKIIYISYLLFAITFTGCTYKDQKHGVNIEAKMLKEAKLLLKDEKLNANNLKSILGPESSSYQLNNKTYLLYMSFTRVTPPMRKDFIKDFTTYEFISDNNEIIALNEYTSLNEISINPNITEIETKKFSIIKQILGNIGKIAGTSHGE
jgi:hypothetical protein